MVDQTGRSLAILGGAVAFSFYHTFTKGTQAPLWRCAFVVMQTENHEYDCDRGQSSEQQLKLLDSIFMPSACTRKAMGNWRARFLAGFEHGLWRSRARGEKSVTV
jgi:hypothetical protein